MADQDEIARVRQELEAERRRSQDRLETVMRLRAEVANLRAAPTPATVPTATTEPRVGALGGADGKVAGVVDLDDERVLQEVGIYRYHHPLANAAAFKERLAAVQQRIKDQVRNGSAIEASEMFIYDNSLAKGRRMTSDLGKLMLRAYNAEADICVRTLRPGNSITATQRLEKAAAAIERLGSMMEMRIAPAYRRLRIEEIELTADFVMKQQEEKERERDERRRLREERQAQKELEAERARLRKERDHYANALAALRASGDADDADLVAKLSELDDAIAHNDYRLANVRAGYVYVISNRGSLGPNVVKIGLTRRLDPLDRVRELSGASVPFPFDVHALFFADDAVTLEHDLHRAFADLRVNRVNERREFFFATPAQVRAVLLEQVGSLLEFVDDAEATQFHQSRPLWPSAQVAPR